MTVGEFYIAWHQAHGVKPGFDSTAVQDSYTLFMGRFCAPSDEITPGTMSLLSLGLEIFHALDVAVQMSSGKGYTAKDLEAIAKGFGVVVTAYEKNKSKTTS